MKIVLDHAATFPHISEVQYKNKSSRPINSEVLSNWEAFGLGIISGFIGSGCPPSSLEIASCLGITKQGTLKMVAALKEKGFISTVPGRVRSIRLTNKPKQTTGATR